MTEDDHKDDPPEPEAPPKTLAEQVGFLKVEETGEETAAGRVGRLSSMIHDHGTVMALREYMVTVEPNLKFDVDRFVEQTEGQSDHVLRVIISDKGVSCAEFEIETGILSSDQIEALAKGFLEDRLREQEKGLSRQQIVLTVILTAVATWLVTVATSAA